MKIIIGITRNPESIGELVGQRRGSKSSLTEIGPFVSKREALNWLEYLKNRIGDFEEIVAAQEPGNEAVWYGFTFEQARGNS